MTRRMYQCAVVVIAAILIAGNAAAVSGVPLEKCVIITSPQGAAPVVKAAGMLRDEIQKRTGLRLEQQPALPGDAIPAIVLGIADSVPPGTPKPPASITVPKTAEGYAIWVDAASRKAPTICIVGKDVRGTLFGVGRLLRALHMKKGELSLDANFRISTAPRYPVRGHELGYRNKSNTYDAWTVGQCEQYIRDLAVFGANTVQLVVQLDTMAKDGPHMTESVMERTVKLTPLIGEYGLRVWIWLAPAEKAITPQTAPTVLEHCRTLFEKCAPIDAIFVPGGDPGDTPPEVLLPMLKDMAALLRTSHPGAEVWLSNEDMSHDWNATLFKSISQEQPDWLSGVVFGTWVKHSLQEMRAKLPAKYPIVRYPDITHCIECQYPVDEWDRAFAFTLGREPINPRPVATAHIHNVMAPLTIGFNTYSDGVNDDVNKIIWSALGWNPDANLTEVLTEYGRYFIGEDLGDKVAKGLLALEKNWQGPLLKNAGVEKTLALWQEIEKQAGKDAETNWRLQMGLLRANYDAYIQRRLKSETELEQKALTKLNDAGKGGVSSAVEAARAILAEPDAKPVASELRSQTEKLGAALFKSIGMQLSVPKYGAANWERGAVLDALDMPMNDRPWLEGQFKEILAIPDEPARMKRLETVLNWEKPGPGGFYDDLGNATKEPHLVHQTDWVADPGFVGSSQNEYIEIKGRETWRQSWDQGQTLFGTPLRMHYNKLDPKASYTLRVVYTGRFQSAMRLVANEKYEVHASLPQPPEPKVLEFPIPKEATASGTLDLEWQLVKGQRNGARGCQVAEVWLLRTGG